MHAGHDYDLIINSSVKKAVGKSPQTYTPCLTVNKRESFRVCQQGFNDAIHCCKKLVTKPRSLILIPEVGVFNVRGCSRSEDRWLHLDRERICSRT
jgi:hypothetical protein